MLWLLSAAALAADRPAPCARDGQTRHRIEATVQLDDPRVVVEQTVHLTNDGPDDWADVRFRLPALPATLHFPLAEVGPDRIHPTVEGNALVVDAPVAAGTSVAIRLTYDLSLTRLKTPLDSPVGFGRADPWILLADWLPMVVPRVDGDWVIRPKVEFGDHANFPPADFDLVLHAPADWTAHATGTVASEGGTHTITARGTRELAVGLCRGCVTERVTVGPTTLVLVGQQIAPLTRSTAAGSLAWLTERLGPLTDPELDILLVDGGSFGIEFPGLIVQTATRPDYRASHAYIVAHEVAHQWFYNEVGNDQFADPWVDEALATWAGREWLRKTNAPDALQLLADLDGEVDTDAGRVTATVADYTHATYGTRVYTKGARFWEAVAAAEPTAFDRALRAYVADNRCGQTTDRTLFDGILAQPDVDRKQLERLWTRWIDPGF